MGGMDHASCFAHGLPCFAMLRTAQRRDKWREEIPGSKEGVKGGRGVKLLLPQKCLPHLLVPLYLSASILMRERIQNHGWTDAGQFTLGSCLPFMP